METELEDAPQFRGLSYEAYMRNSRKRRNAEQWIKNLVNFCHDAAKIVVASGNQHIPQTIVEERYHLFIKAIGSHIAK